MRTRLLAFAATVGLTSLSIATSLPAAAQQKVEATLRGHAALPAMTLIQPPEQAGEFYTLSGRFTAPDRRRVDRPGTIATTSFIAVPAAPRSTGIGLPLPGQPVQGFSGIRALANGEFFALTDNGYGSKINSVDTLLMVHRVRPNWDSGAVERVETIFLSDPNKVLPFTIREEGSAWRYLTGADLDLESIAVIGDRIWIGEEFGPYLLEFGRDGKLLSFHETKVDGADVRGPDHYRNAQLPNVPGDVTFEVRRSRGFEPMAATPDGRSLMVMFEGPLWNREAKAFETRDGKAAVRIIEFDPAGKSWTGRQWVYLLEEGANVIGDIAMIDATSALVIERDDASEGSQAQACPADQPRLDCFNRPAQFKRVYKVVFGEPGSVVRKAAYVDLTDIADPQRRARIGQAGERFVMPHLGPEGVALVDGESFVIVNDNNLPYSSGRTIGKADDNEIAWIASPALLSAR